MKFKYLKLALTEPSPFFGPVLLKPIIPIELICEGRRFRYGALIDSGADFCMLDGAVGEYIGIDVRAGERFEFGGVEESVGSEAFFHTIRMNVGGYEFSAKVGFSYNIANHGFAILGQKGFFDVFIVSFDWRKEEIALKPQK
jgi:hypothetical protein